MKDKSKVVCLGNGESRLNLDLDKIKEQVMVWGCNALYRDWIPDYLVCCDIEMSHEIYRSGYCFDNVVYFRDWSRLPAEAYDQVVVIEHISNSEIDMGPFLHESSRPEGWNEFVVSGQDLDKIRTIREDYISKVEASGEKVNPHNLDIVLGDVRAGLWVTWLAKEDKVRKTESLPGNSDYSFCSGALCNLFSSLEPETKEIFLLGMDLYSETENANNVYKSTDCYIDAGGSMIPPDNWIKQHRLVFDKFPHIKYYKVNPKPVASFERINREIEEWEGVSNLEYITHSEMNEYFSKKP
jgi:hypothetical protein